MKRPSTKDTNSKNQVIHNPQYFIALFALKFLAAYGFASWAIERGNLLLYFITIGFLVSGIRSFLLFIKSVIGVVHG